MRQDFLLNVISGISQNLLQVLCLYLHFRNRSYFKLRQQPGGALYSARTTICERTDRLFNLNFAILHIHVLHNHIS